MRLQRLEFARFRNLEAGAVEFGDRFTLLSGANAQGKTNLLEAVFLLSELRSFRAARISEIVRHDAPAARLAAAATAGGLDYEVQAALAPGTLSLRVNGKAIVRRKDFIGRLPMVLFAPEDVGLSKGQPSARRRFLDRTLFLLDPGHWERTVEFRQLLERRNLLLKQKRTADSLFAVYSEKLAAVGAAISAARHALARRLSATVGPAVREVSDAGEAAALDYQTHLTIEDGEARADGGERLKALLAERLPIDRERGRTTAGPQTEDLLVSLDGRPAAQVASQGQHRTIALVLKIAEIQVIHEARRIFPLLLVDDLSSELDGRRRERLFDYLKRCGGQVVLTSTEPQLNGLAGEDVRRYVVTRGEVRPGD
ncbi:MAG: DNA replication and repair protein RecF [Myxococcales bacterium]|nr:MAG: DNA replication and repair protein RecF [Myxococcales bacterium]